MPQADAEPDWKNGKLESWAAAAPPIRYLLPASSALANPAAKPIRHEIPKLTSGRLKSEKASGPPYKSAIVAPAAIQTAVLTQSAAMPCLASFRSPIHSPKLTARTWDKNGRNS